MVFNIALLPGDGQGPQLAHHAKRILNLIQPVRPNVSFSISTHDFAGAALATCTESSLPASTLQAAKSADAVLAYGVGNAPVWPGAGKGVTCSAERT